MLARLYTGCNDVISLRNSYHGNAAGKMGVTAQSNWKFSVIQVYIFRHLVAYISGRLLKYWPFSLKSQYLLRVM